MAAHQWEALVFVGKPTGNPCTQRKRLCNGLPAAVNATAVAHPLTARGGGKNFPRRVYAVSEHIVYIRALQAGNQRYRQVMNREKLN